MSKFVKRLKKNPLLLPLPRLQMETIRKEGKQTICEYSLLYEHLTKETIKVILGITTIDESPKSEKPTFYIPFRTGADMLYDMYSMKMRGFNINGSDWEERFITYEEMPNALRAKIQEMGKYEAI